MQIATWNVNSLKVRLEQVIEWLGRYPQVGVLCLQETKVEDANFPVEVFQAAGFHLAFAGQKTYNGVALISRHPLYDIQINIPNFIDEQKRVISATCEGIRIVCAYMPNGQAVDSDKYQYKLVWLNALTSWLKEELHRYPKLALLGDYNIAPADRDVYDPEKWIGDVLVSPAEREAFQALLDLGLVDSFHLFTQEEKLFSWWDYRKFAFRRNAGLRIDHILLSTALAPQCIACEIDKLPRAHERPSDHTPVIATLTL
jgi:exodeoxyribonuclease-3